MLWGFMALRGHRLGLQQKKAVRHVNNLLQRKQAWLSALPCKSAMVLHICMCVLVCVCNSVTPYVCVLSLLLQRPFSEKKKKTWPKVCNGNSLLHLDSLHLTLVCPLSVSLPCSLSLILFGMVTEKYTICPSAHFLSCIFCSLYPPCPWPRCTSLSVSCLSFMSLSLFFLTV